MFTGYDNSTPANADPWKIILIQLAYTICGCMLSERFFAGLETKRAPLEVFIQVMQRLAELPGSCPEVVIRFRGLKTGPRLSPDYDYEIVAGDLHVDLQEAEAIVKRRGAAEMHLHGRLLKAWEVFKSYGISSIALKIPADDETEWDHLRLNMHILSKFYQAVRQQGPLIIDMDGDQLEAPLIIDRRGLPDPNLTLFAAVNRLDREDVAVLVAKHGKGEKGEEAGTLAARLYAAPEIGRRLRIPPIQINLLEWRPSENGSTPGTPAVDLSLGAALAKVFGAESAKLKMVSDYLVGKQAPIAADAEALLRRLQLVTEFIEALSGLPEFADIRRRVIERVKRRLAEVPPEMARALVPHGKDGLEFRRPGADPVVARVLPEFCARFEAEPQKAASVGGVYHKLKNIHRAETRFTKAELVELARKFRTPVDEIDMFLRALRRCFDAEGNFSSELFRQHGAILAYYTEQVFPILLYYLKTTASRKGRIGLLNHLPVLFEKVERPRRVIRTLLEELSGSSEEIHLFDRNLSMLAIQLLRGYRKESDIEIEATPEEVLLVQKGLREDAVAYGQKALQECAPEMRRKLAAVHQALVASLQQNDEEIDDPAGKPRFLFSLWREMVILLGLIGGTSAKGMLAAVVQQLAEAEGDIYRQRRSSAHLDEIFGLLRTSVRAYVRLASGAADERQLLGQVKSAISHLGKKVRSQRQRRLLAAVADLSDLYLQ